MLDLNVRYVSKLALFGTEDSLSQKEYMWFHQYITGFGNATLEAGHFNVLCRVHLVKIHSFKNQFPSRSMRKYDVYQEKSFTA